MNIDCAASIPAPVVNTHAMPVFDLTQTVVTGWVVKAGPYPEGWVSPCTDANTAPIVTGYLTNTNTCVAEPMLVPGYWAQPYFDATKEHVTGWIVKAGDAPADYVNPCKTEEESVDDLEELNWLSHKLKDARAAAKAEQDKINSALKKRISDIKNASKAQALKIKAAMYAKYQADMQKAIIAAKQFAAISVDSAKKVIGAVSEGAKLEGAKLANQLINDAEDEGQVLDEAAKIKILALSIQVGQQVSDKVADADIKFDHMLADKKTLGFEKVIIDSIKQKGHDITIVGQEKAIAIASLLGNLAENQVDALEKKADDKLDTKRPVALVMLI